MAAADELIGGRSHPLNNPPLFGNFNDGPTSQTGGPRDEVHSEKLPPAPLNSRELDIPHELPIAAIPPPASQLNDAEDGLPGEGEFSIIGPTHGRGTTPLAEATMASNQSSPSSNVKNSFGLLSGISTPSSATTTSDPIAQMAVSPGIGSNSKPPPDIIIDDSSPQDPADLSLIVDSEKPSAIQTMAEMLRQDLDDDPFSTDPAAKRVATLACALVEGRL